jgi:hypothetical protein
MAYGFGQSLSSSFAWVRLFMSMDYEYNEGDSSGKKAARYDAGYADA